MQNLRQAIIDLFIVVVRCYGNGFASAWLLTLPGLDPHRTGSLFAFVGWLLAIWGIETRIRTGKFPLPIAILVGPVPFFFTFLGVSWQIVTRIQKWLGVI